MDLNAEVLLDEATMEAVYEWREGLDVLREYAPQAVPEIDAEWQAVLTIADWQAAFEPMTVDDALAWGIVLTGETVADLVMRDTIAKGEG
jgi:hypothetical protein